MKIETYTGGPVATNAYLVHAPEGCILVDAPEGVGEWVQTRLGGKKLLHLLLTHGHYDHMFDAAHVKELTGCDVWVHDDSRRLVEHPETMLLFSPYEHIDPATPDHGIEEGKKLTLAGATFETFLCPGHCPGSICFYDASGRILYGGDVLFAGGVGRWDLPGGSFEELSGAIRKKLYRLPDETRVLPGHGPPTTIGIEKRSNPFVRPA